jgi:hypothetical protein
MKARDQYDISSSSFDEFVDFLFKREVVPLPEGPDRDKKPEPWYWHADVTFDTRRVLTFYVQLFEGPEFLMARYSKEQLEQGFWAIISGNIECSVTEVIWEKKIPFEERAACVRSMYHLFERFFLKEPLETSSNMWWDALAYDWHCDNRSRANGGEDESMQDVMYETLERILVLPNEACQAAALHGIGHLHHPRTPEAIERFLARQLSPELRDYALAAGRFEIM